MRPASLIKPPPSLSEAPKAKEIDASALRLLHPGEAFMHEMSKQVDCMLRLDLVGTFPREEKLWTG